MRHHDLWSRLSTRSRRSLQRRRKRFGHPYQYQPRKVLLERLSQELGISEADVRERLHELRQSLL
ncbi:MAG TPA: hypothetical protein V6D10_05785 [Trichocoleus sp.]|jgi:hypothetical protein